jgi:hypothetical protein
VLKHLDAVVTIVNPTADADPALNSMTLYEQFEKLLVDASIPLLKKEWNRVKKGEFGFWFLKCLAVVVAVFGAVAVGVWIKS